MGVATDGSAARRPDLAPVAAQGGNGGVVLHPFSFQFSSLDEEVLGVAVRPVG